jgi:hypothetical protein
VEGENLDKKEIFEHVSIENNSSADPKTDGISSA